MNDDVPFEIYRYDHNGNLKKQVVPSPKKSSTKPDYAPPRKTKKENKNSHWKTNLVAASLIAAGVFGSYLAINNKIHNYTQKHSEKQKIELQKGHTTQINYIAHAKYKGKIYNFTANDAFMIDLSNKNNYFNLEDLTLNKDSLNTTLNIAKQLTLSEIMETANLNGMHKLYTNYSNGKINFESALSKLWLAKVAKMKGRFPLLALKFREDYNSTTTEKTNLPEYKSKIKKELEIVLKEFDYNSLYKKHNNQKKKSGSPEKQRFFENYFAHINENVLTAYGVTELFSSDVNPALNIVFLDKLLQDAGEEFINKIPAIYDEYLSFGFFQLTSKIITPEGAPSLNKYLPKSSKIPASMKYYKTSEEQIRGAILVNLYNAEILANTLFNANEITNFNNNFEKLTPEQQEIFIAGYASAAHHASGDAANAVADYQKLVDSKNKSFKNIITDLPLGKSLKKYYNQSLKNYLVLKAMDK